MKSAQRKCRSLEATATVCHPGSGQPYPVVPARSPKQATNWPWISPHPLPYLLCKDLKTRISVKLRHSPKTASPDAKLLPHNSMYPNQTETSEATKLIKYHMLWVTFPKASRNWHLYYLWVHPFRVQKHVHTSKQTQLNLNYPEEDDPRFFLFLPFPVAHFLASLAISPQPRIGHGM